MRALTTMCILWTWGFACRPEVQPRLDEGKLPPNMYVDLVGIFTLSPAGELSLALAEPCAVSVRLNWRETVSLRCHPYLLNLVHVVAKTPWGSRIPGVWLDED